MRFAARNLINTNTKTRMKNGKAREQELEEKGGQA